MSQPARLRRFLRLSLGLGGGVERSKLSAKGRNTAKLAGAWSFLARWFIFVKDDIENPVQVVLNLPVRTNHVHEGERRC